MSSSNSIRPEDLSHAVERALLEYRDASTETVKQAIKNAAETAVSEIETTAPRDTGAYARDWKVKVVAETVDKLAVVAYSPNHYRLTHLLEHGHANRGGGRTKAYPHIAAAQEKAEQQLEREITGGL